MTETHEQTPDHDRLRDALSTALASSPGMAGRPGLLRNKVESALGADASRLGGAVHQLIVAAEEHVPGRLSGLVPLTEESVDRVGEDLAVARGWSGETGRRTAALWASALGLERDESTGGASASGSPVGPRLAGVPKAPDLLAGARVSAPGASRSVPPPAGRPRESAGAWNGFAATSLPDSGLDERTMLPPDADPRPFGAPVPPATPPAGLATPPAGLATPPAGLATPPAGPATPAAPPAPADWPAKIPRRLRKFATSTQGPVLSAAQAYGGISVVVYSAAIAALLVVVAVGALFFVPPGSGGAPVIAILIAVGIALGLGRLLKPGLAVATDHGLEFTEFDVRMTRPKMATRVAIPWSDLVVTVGAYSIATYPAGQIRLGPKNQAFARAAAFHAHSAAQAGRA